MLFSLWLAAVLVQQPAENPPADAAVTTLARLEADWNTAHVRGDAAALEHLFADDLVVVVPGMRVMTKADALGMFSSGRMKFDRYETSETKFRVYDATAIVTGRLRRTRTIAGATVGRLEVHEGVPPPHGTLAGRLVSRVQHRALNLNEGPRGGRILPTAREAISGDAHLGRRDA